MACCSRLNDRVIERRYAAIPCRACAGARVLASPLDRLVGVSVEPREQTRKAGRREAD
jgi:hypothetical protein